MHILLTDILTCPRCGPAFGLILLADQVVDRRVLEGRLGCANCREQYPVHEGIARFGGTAGKPVADGPGTPGTDTGAGANTGSGSTAARSPEDPDTAMRLAGLMGVTEGPGHMVLLGDAAAHATAVADMIPGVQVVAAGSDLAAWPPLPAEYASGDGGVSRVEVSGRLPFASGRLLGIAVTGSCADAWLEEAARMVAPARRLVLDPAPADAEARLVPSGLQVVAHEGSTLVAARTGAPA
ncbi:MAG TPA: Trm112 family protein [Longimicrobiales bacterium]|nr:Trm112 family protein [Longimicrobiales bacterium]